MRHRSALSLALLALATASCGAPSSPVAEESTRIDEVLPPVDQVVAPAAEPATGPLSIDDALLHGEDAPAPWEVQHRDLEQFAYDIGANQTDCAPYWKYEGLSRLEGGETMWWRDGGNLNHLVRRESRPGEASELIEGFADLPSTCGVTSWSEGDFFTITPLSIGSTPGSETIVALAIDHARTDEVTWLAFAQHGDLISELRVTMWPEFESGAIPDFSPDDFGAVAVTMNARLATAGAAPAVPDPDVAPTTIPGRAPQETSPPATAPVQSSPPEIDLPQLEPVLPTTNPPATGQTTTTTTTTTTLPPLAGVAAALLTDVDLPDGWYAERAEAFGRTGDDDEPLAGCPESIAIIDLQAHFDFTSDLGQTDGPGSSRWGTQLIGLAPSVVDATAATDALGQLDGCIGTEDGIVFTLSAEQVDIDGADAAWVVGIESTENFILAVATVGPVVTAFSLFDDAPYVDLLQRSVDKLIETGPY